MKILDGFHSRIALAMAGKNPWGSSSGGGDDGDAFLVRVVDRFLEHEAWQRAAEAHVDDLSAVICGEAHGIGDIGDLTEAARVQHAHLR